MRMNTVSSIPPLVATLIAGLVGVAVQAGDAPDPMLSAGDFTVRRTDAEAYLQPVDGLP
jgi:hypothetical protein